jgi:hypothetical protein
VDSLLNNICVWSLPQSYLDFIVSCGDSTDSWKNPYSPQYGQTENSIEKDTDAFLYMFLHLFFPSIMSPFAVKSISLVFWLLKISQRESGDRAVHYGGEQPLNDRYLFNVSCTDYEAKKIDYKDSGCVPRSTIPTVAKRSSRSGYTSRNRLRSATLR